jgi:hypothetical protein
MKNDDDDDYQGYHISIARKEDIYHLSTKKKEYIFYFLHKNIITQILVCEF